MTMGRKRAVAGFLFVLPWVVGFVLFFMYPLILSVRLSFSDITQPVGMKMKWVGFENYLRAFVVDIDFMPAFIQTVKNTLTNTPLTVIFSVVFALILNRRMRLRAFFRGTFFLPVLLGTGIIMKQLVEMRVGAEEYQIASGVALPQDLALYLPPAVFDFITKFLQTVTVIFWKSGVQILLILGGLQSIPRQLYESAGCDSATEWEMFWKITLPMLSPIVLLSTVYTFVDYFGDSGNPMVTYILAFVIGKNRPVSIEYASAMSWIYCLFVFAVIITAFVSFRGAVSNAGEK